MQAFLQLYLANVKEFMRDRMAMFWTLAFPIVFILIFGTIFSNVESLSIDVGLAQEDTGPLGANLAAALGAVDNLHITSGPRAALMDQLNHGTLRAVIVIPAGLTAQVTSGRPASVEVFYDSSNQTSSIAVSITTQVVAGFDKNLTQRPTLLTVQSQTVTPETLRQIDFLLPGILAMSLMQLGLFGTAPALVQLREQQVLRRLGATPLPRATLLAAQVLHRLTIGAAQTGLTLGVGIFIFGVKIVGNGLLLGLAVLLGALMFVAIGYLISGLAKTQESVTGISQLINFPMMFLSGLFFPIEFVPGWLRPVVAALPLTYLADALRQIMVGATSSLPLSTDFAVLAAWLVGVTLLALRFFRWES
jgi:ABC-2 type transport system permease protein